jgi:hypothetical protein
MGLQRATTKLRDGSRLCVTLRRILRLMINILFTVWDELERKIEGKYYMPRLHLAQLQKPSNVVNMNSLADMLAIDLSSNEAILMIQR